MRYWHILSLVFLSIGVQGQPASSITGIRVTSTTVDVLAGFRHGETTREGAEVRTVTFAPNGNTATVDVANTSAKDITAYAIAYDLSYADGHHEKGERVVEYLQGIISSQERLGANWSGEGVFHPGETRKEVFLLSEPTKEKRVLTMSAAVDVVIYMDQTADVGNDDAFNLLISDRSATARAAKEMSAILQNALANQSDPHPFGAASAKLRQLVKESTGSLPAKAEIQRLINNLAAVRASGAVDEREYIRATIAKKNQQAIVTIQHAQVGGQQ